MDNKSVFSRGESLPTNASPLTSPIPPPSPTQEHVGRKSTDMDSMNADKTLVPATIKKIDSMDADKAIVTTNTDPQLPYGEMIIRRDMETWEALSMPKYFAQRRMDFLNSTNWFRGQQTGYWSTNSGDPRNGTDADGEEKKYCTGLYIAGCPPDGRYIDAEVIITALNGPDNADDKVTSRERETRHSMEDRVPVGVAVSKDACKPDDGGLRTLPCPLPDGLDCAVLAWFMVTHMWPRPGTSKKGEPKTIWMVRLEKIDLSERSWWSNGAHASLPHPSLEERDFTTKAAKETCETCEAASVRLFKSNFVCLNEQCANWFRVNGAVVEVERGNMAYNDDFLAERYDRLDGALAPLPLEETYPSLYPTFDQFLDNQYVHHEGSGSPITAETLAAANEALLLGFSCPQCGMANSRIQYHGWYCRNTSCRDAQGRAIPFGYHAPPPTVTPALLEAERKHARKGKKAASSAAEEDNKPLSDLFRYQGARDVGSHVAHDLDFGNGCRATILRPRPGGAAAATADELLARVQESASSGALGLARRTQKAPGGVSLTNHFAENFGERYRLPYGLSNIPLGQAPDVVGDALTSANVYMKEYFGNGNKECEFNEVYFAAYLSKMGMSFHDDGEKGLGSVIGTWTLGGHATFKFCIKPQFDYGRRQKGGNWMKPQGGLVDLVPAGCFEEEFRAGLKAKFERGEISAKEWTGELQKHMDANPKISAYKNLYPKRTLVSFTVEHGDVVIMWGPNTQRYMEHAVDCCSPLRFAITLRRVTKDMGTAEQWAGLGERLEADRAFTPSWAGAAKRKAEEETEEEEGEGQPAGAKKSKEK